MVSDFISSTIIPTKSGFCYAQIIEYREREREGEIAAEKGTEKEEKERGVVGVRDLVSLNRGA